MKIEKEYNICLEVDEVMNNKKIVIELNFIGNLIKNIREFIYNRSIATENIMTCDIRGDRMVYLFPRNVKPWHIKEIRLE